MAKKKKLTRVSTQELASELDRRRKRLPALRRKRDQLLQQLDEVEAQMADLGAAGGGRAGKKKRTRKKSGRKKAARKKATRKKAGKKKTTRRKRPRNEMPLGDALVKAMKGRKQPAGVGDLVEAVKKQGYKSSASNFRSIVNQTLLKDNRFKNVGRGQYQLK